MGAAPAAAPAGAAPTPALLTAPDTRPFHAGNLFIHLSAALVLFGIVRRTLSSPRLHERFGLAAPWLAAAVALLWVVHPLQTAAVTYVVQRVESLMGLFYLLTLYCAIRAAEGSRAGWWAAAAVASCAAGMATKESMVTAPVVVALWDWLFGARPDGQPSRVRWGLLGSLAATWVLLGYPGVAAVPRAVHRSGTGDDLAVRADTGRSDRALPPTGVLPVAAGVPLRLAALAGAALDGLAGSAAHRRRRADRRRNSEAPPGVLPRRMVLLDPRALFERPADCVGSSGRAPDVPAAGRDCCRRGSGRLPGGHAGDGTLDTRSRGRRGDCVPDRGGRPRHRGAVAEPRCTGAPKGCGRTRSRSGPTTRVRAWPTARRSGRPAASLQPRCSWSAPSNWRRRTGWRASGWARCWPRRASTKRRWAQLVAGLALRPGDVDAHRFLGEIYAIQRRDGLASSTSATRSPPCRPTPDHGPMAAIGGLAGPVRDPLRATLAERPRRSLAARRLGFRMLATLRRIATVRDPALTGEAARG